MGALLKWSARGLAFCLMLVLALGIWKRDEIRRLWAVNTLFDEDQIVANFSNMKDLFLVTDLDRGDGPVSPLTGIAVDRLGPDVDDWVLARDVTSMVVLKDGALVHENYFLGTDPLDLRIGWSVSKSLLSALFGVVMAEGGIGSLDDMVKEYVPSLAGTAYDGVSVRNVLNMTSGVAFNEDYLDYYSDINRMGRVLALGQSMDDFAISLTDRIGPPGEVWKYVSIDTHVVAMVLRAATGRSIPDLMSEKLIKPLGLEAAPYYLTDGDGTAFALGGVNMSTRDFARFGLLYAQGGQINGTQVIPADWVEMSTSPTAPTETGETGFGFQWWVPKTAEPGEFMARGIYGQYIYVNRSKGIVIACTAADLGFREDGAIDQSVAVFRQIAETL